MLQPATIQRPKCTSKRLCLFIDEHDDDTDLLSALIDAFDSDDEVPLAPPEPKQENTSQSSQKTRSKPEVPDGQSATSPPRESVKVRNEKPGVSLPTADPKKKNDSGEIGRASCRERV